MTRPADRGELALVLHTHMPYVEGYGTWPFGEEWLWEAIATSYLPLLDLLERHAPPLTLSITPVLADQLDAPGVAQRLRAFLRDVRGETHRHELAVHRARGEDVAVAELRRSARQYAAAAEHPALEDLAGALMRHASWTSAATHALLPLVATDAGLALQIEAGVAGHRRRRGDWAGGFWLPECAWAPWLEPRLADAGARATCLDLTDVLGRAAAAQLRPLVLASGLVLHPIDRVTLELAWSADGYPSHGAYRDYHALTERHHRVRANHGGPYDHAAALALAREHAADFVARTLARLDAGRRELGRPGLAVCALDTELLGHWWYEGMDWLAAVLEEADRQGLALTTLDAARERHEPVPAPAAELPICSWGTPRDLSTWDAPAVADLTWQARAAELEVVAAAGGASAAAVRELLALQSSDWAFMATRELAGEYPRERASGHARALHAALARLDSASPAEPPGPRNLAPGATAAALLRP